MCLNRLDQMFGCSAVPAMKLYLQLLHFQNTLLQWPQVRKGNKNKFAAKVVKEKLHPLVPASDQWPVLSKVMQSCFAFVPASRPTFDSICETLQKEVPNDVPTNPGTRNKVMNVTGSEADYISKF